MIRMGTVTHELGAEVSNFSWTTYLHYANVLFVVEIILLICRMAYDLGKFWKSKKKKIKKFNWLGVGHIYWIHWMHSLLVSHDIQ